MTVHLCGARLIRTVVAIGIVMATRSTTAAQVNQPFAIGSVSAARGSKASGMLTVDAGTISERIAHRITNDIIKRADYVVDIHSGDANEDLRPWTGYYSGHGTPDVIARSREMAVAFGFDHIVLLPQTPKTPAEAIYTGATAVALGKPSFDVESGGLGVVDPGAFGRIADGVMSLLRHLRMLAGAPAPAARPIFIATRSSVASDNDGIFYRQVKAGEQVNAGAALGYITDFFGNRVAELRAPKTGVVLSVFGTPPVRKGETVVVIGHTEETKR